MADKIYSSIIDKCSFFRKKFIIYSVFESIILFITILFFILAGSSIIEAFFFLAPSYKTFLIYFSLSISSAAGILVIILRAMKIPDDETVCRYVEKKYPLINSKLISAVQLGRIKDEELKGQSKDLINALISEAEKETRQIDFSSVVSIVFLKKIFKTLMILVVSYLIVFFVFPSKISGGIFRLADNRNVYVSISDTDIVLENFNRIIIKGDNFILKGTVKGDSYPRVNLLFRWENEDKWIIKPIDINTSTGKFVVSIEKPFKTFEFYLESAEKTTDKIKITVVERPEIKKMTLTVINPAYSGLGNIEMKAGDGNVEALRGARIKYSLEANKPLKYMSICFEDSSKIDCTVNGAYSETELTVLRTTDYFFTMKDTSDILNIKPIIFKLVCIDDEKPEVRFIDSEEKSQLSVSMDFPIAVSASDDFGLTSIKLNYLLPGDERKNEITIKKGIIGKETNLEYIWNLSGLSLLPDDEVTYFVTVYDNDTISGPKQSSTAKRTIKVPSISDIFTNAENAQEKKLESLEEYKSETNEMTKEVEKLKKSVINGEKLDWSDKNLIEKSKKSMENLGNELKESAKEMRKDAENLSEENLAAIETLEKMKQISNLMDDIEEGKIKDALRMLTNSAVSMDPSQIKKALENYEISAKEIMSKLDDVISMLEQVKTIQKFDLSKRLLEEMISKQLGIKEKLNASHDNKNISEEESRLGSEMKKLEQEINNSAKDLQKLFKTDISKIEEFLKKNEISSSMKEISSSMKEGDLKTTDEQMEKTNNLMNQLLSEMEKVSQSINKSNTAEMKKTAFEALEKMISVSKKQGDIIYGNNDSKSKTDYVRKETETMDAFLKSWETIEKLKKMSPDLAGVLDSYKIPIESSMKNSLDAFLVGKHDAGKTLLKEALKDVNELTYFLTRLFEGTGKKGSQGMPGDLMQQLQMIADGQLSMQMNMSEGMDGEMMQRMAAEQEKLSEMLSELGKKASQDKRLREMLEKLGEDMKDTAGMMRRNEKRELIERKQLDIYRRLLDAKRSRREKDESKERQSWTAKEDKSKGADILDKNMGENKPYINELIKKAMKDNYSAEYKEIIRKYFESMLGDETVYLHKGK